MIVAVTGGRDYADIENVRRVFSFLDPRPALLIHGAATGVDSLAAQVASELGIPIEAHPADWKKHGVQPARFGTPRCALASPTSSSRFQAERARRT
jgi:hypothetical protein